MKEQFCTYEIALALKGLGYNERCFNLFNNGVLGRNVNNTFSNQNYDLSRELISAPLWQQAIDFIWEKYYILINAYQKSPCDIIWQVSYEFFPTKEQAILKAIKLIKNKEK